MLEPDSSTSCRSDCRKLGALGSRVNCRPGTVLARRDDWRDLEFVEVEAVLSDAERIGTLGRLRLITTAASCWGSAGDDVPDRRFLLRDELGSFDVARACSKACHAMSSSAFSTAGAGEGRVRKLRGVRELPGLWEAVGSVSLKRFPTPCSSATCIRRIHASCACRFAWLRWRWRRRYVADESSSS